MAELMLGQPLFPGESGIDQLVEIIKVLGTPTREQIRTMNPNYMEHKFPQIKPHPFNKVCYFPPNLAALRTMFTRLRFSERHRPKPLISSQPYLSIRLLSVFQPLKPCVIRSLTSCVSPTADFLILVIRMVHQRSYRNCSTFQNTVCYVFFEYVITINIVIELSIAPDENTRLVPSHARKALLAKGLDLENLVPLTKDEMMARLD